MFFHFIWKFLLFTEIWYHVCMSVILAHFVTWLCVVTPTQLKRFSWTADGLMMVRWCHSLLRCVSPTKRDNGNMSHDSWSNLWHSSCLYFLKLFLCEVWSTFVLEKQIMEKDPCNDTVCCNTSVALWLFTHIIKSNRFVFLVCISNLKLVRFDPVYLLTDAGTNTLIPHVVVYRPCFHIQRLASNIYFWTHVVFTRHMCRQSGLFMSYTVWFFYIYKKNCNCIWQILQCFLYLYFII